ncbi:MAG: ribose-phosphate pyrophosphokinase [Clostridia bacterium]|nr:ribose-phosphate pyrophosphokinase [Clostridia bacterium]
MAIFLNSKKINTSAKFPDGTFAFRTPKHNSLGVSFIVWQYESEEEALALYYLVKHLRSQDRYYQIYLTMYYVPNARMDRTHGDDEVFTLKYFADFINSMHFDEVAILDPHSSVSSALLNNVKIISPKPFIERAIADINHDDLVMFYPDEGAMKRYSGLVQKPYGFGVKRRDWRTGKIEGLKIEGSVDFSGKTVLLVDDICCRGGTFFHSAKALKEAGAAHIYLYCTHCEKAIFDGELLSSDMIDGIYTTNSIFDDTHHKITVFDCGETLEA